MFPPRSDPRYPPATSSSVQQYTPRRVERPYRLAVRGSERFVLAFRVLSGIERRIELIECGGREFDDCEDLWCGVGDQSIIDADFIELEKMNRPFYEKLLYRRNVSLIREVFAGISRIIATRASKFAIVDLVSDLTGMEVIHRANETARRLSYDIEIRPCGNNGHLYRVVVTNLPEGTESDQLKEFARLVPGGVWASFVMRGTTVGWIAFSSVEKMNEAITILDNFEFDGNIVRVYSEEDYLEGRHPPPPSTSKISPPILPTTRFKRPPRPSRAMQVLPPPSTDPTSKISSPPPLPSPPSYPPPFVPRPPRPPAPPALHHHHPIPPSLPPPRISPKGPPPPPQSSYTDARKPGLKAPPRRYIPPQHTRPFLTIEEAYPVPRGKYIPPAERRKDPDRN